MTINTKKYIESYLKIRTKESEIISLHLNSPQVKLYDAIKAQAEQGKPIRIIVLKARQMGFSTLTEAVIFKRTATAANVTSAIVTQKEEATTNLFEMSKRFFSCLPDELKPMRAKTNAKELVFDDRDDAGLGSRIKCFTAGGDAIGRSDTIQNLHVSEYAFWSGNKKEILNGLLAAVPNTPNSMVVIESTANGYDDFKNLWDKAVNGESDFLPVFCAWYELLEYRMSAKEFEPTEDENDLKARYKLSNEQLAWRRWCIANNCGGDEDLFKQEYPSNPEEAFLTTGSCVFDKEKIICRLSQVELPLLRGDFIPILSGMGELTGYTWSEDARGNVKIYLAPQEGCPYVVGGDTAGEGSDRFTAHVLDNTTGRQVALLKQEGADEDMYAQQVVCLAKMYNEALIGIEANFSTYPTKEVARLGYRNQYIREAADTYTGAVQKSFGFRTTSATRPVIIAELVKAFRENPAIIEDEETLREMLVFVKNARGRAEAMQGEHDDLVMGLAVGFGIRGQQSMLKTVNSAEKTVELPFALKDEEETDECLW